MEATSGINNVSRIEQDPGVTESVANPGATPGTSSNGAAFESYLKALYGGAQASEVSEEALFSSLVRDRIEALKGQEVSSQFGAAFDLQVGNYTRSDGHVGYEDATTATLMELRDSGAITAEEADKIYAEAFQAAQLDGNTEALYDNLGGPGDSTIAVADYSSAVSGAQAILEQIASGALVPMARSLDGAGAGGSSKGLSMSPIDSFSGNGSMVSGTGERITPNGSEFDGQEGFLFKPVSNNQGTLAVLLPEAFKGNVSGVTLMDASGNILDDGVSTGYGDLGTREKFSFSRPGGDYGSDITVHVQFLDGSHVEYQIPDPSQRYD